MWAGRPLEVFHSHNVACDEFSNEARSLFDSRLLLELAARFYLTLTKKSGKLKRVFRCQAPRADVDPLL